MKVKKFVCHQCGAPKVNPYKGIFVICDYCNAMIDIDGTATFEMIFASGEQQLQWNYMLQKYARNVPEYIEKENYDGLKKFLTNYCKQYYQIYPDAIPPNVPGGKKYRAYLDASADFMAYTLTNREFKKAKGKYSYLNGSIYTYVKNGKKYADYAQFSKMMEAYIEYLDMEMKLMYSGKFPIYAQYCPEEFMRKSKISEKAQSWVPQLEDQYAEEFLNKYQLKHEYVEISEPVIDIKNCDACQKEINVPKGSLRFICNHCRHEHVFKSNMNCHNCGMENGLPENWSIKIDCKGCGTELRVVPELRGLI